MLRYWLENAGKKWFWAAGRGFFGVFGLQNVVGRWVFVLVFAYFC